MPAKRYNTWWHLPIRSGAREDSKWCMPAKRVYYLVAPSHPKCCKRREANGASQLKAIPGGTFPSEVVQEEIANGVCQLKEYTT